MQVLRLFCIIYNERDHFFCVEGMKSLSKSVIFSVSYLTYTAVTQHRQTVCQCGAALSVSAEKICTNKKK
jgi:hypothetical protein